MFCIINRFIVWLIGDVGIWGIRKLGYTWILWDIEFGIKCQTQNIGCVMRQHGPQV